MLWEYNKSKGNSKNATPESDPTITYADPVDRAVFNARNFVESGDYSSAMDEYEDAIQTLCFEGKDTEKLNEVGLEMFRMVLDLQDTDIFWRAKAFTSDIVVGEIGKLDPNKISSELIDLCNEVNSYNWYLVSTSTINRSTDTPFVFDCDYNDQGKLSKANVNIYKSNFYGSTEYYFTYEYDDSKENFVTVYERYGDFYSQFPDCTVGDAWRVEEITHDGYECVERFTRVLDDGRRINRRLIYENGEEIERDFETNDVTYHIPYKEEIHINSIKKKMPTLSGEYYYTNYYDKYGNLVKCNVFREAKLDLPYTEEVLVDELDILKSYYNFSYSTGFNYVFCSLDQYKVARANNDFSMYPQSNIHTYVAEQQGQEGTN